MIDPHHMPIGTAALNSGGYNTSPENVFNGITNYIRNNNAYQYLDITSIQHSYGEAEVVITITLPHQVLIDIMK